MKYAVFTASSRKRAALKTLLFNATERSADRRRKGGNAGKPWFPSVRSPGDARRDSSAVSLRQQRTEEHPGDTCDEPGELRRDECFRRAELQREPRGEPGEHRQRRALRRRALPVKAERERRERPGERDLVGVLDHAVDRLAGREREREHGARE